MSSKALTINDVAKAAGVSYQTVSRVINNSPHVAEKTRKRILNTIEKLGYRPNDAARRLSTGRSNSIGIISFGNAYYGPWQVLKGIEASLKQKGYKLHINFIDDPQTETLEDLFADIDIQQLDGILLITPIAELNFNKIKEQLGQTPYVMIDISKGQHIASVLIDQEHGINLATKHLMTLGHKHIASISGPLNWAVAASRQEALEQVLSKTGLKLSLSAEGDWSVKSGYHAAQTLLEKSKAQNLKFSALIVANDHMALGAYRAFKEHGLKIPEDLSIIGFDDIPEAEFIDPPLSTIRQDFNLLGQQSVTYLLSLFEQDAPVPQQRILFPELILRSSTQAVKGLSS